MMDNCQKVNHRFFQISIQNIWFRFYLNIIKNKNQTNSELIKLRIIFNFLKYHLRYFISLTPIYAILTFLKDM